ncbi:inovirus-type Gp2 protein [Paraburkholderia denitrificans]|uniref:Inovirus-type Gp2 protein n=1 Tax=Paraburkholderia denitrificans TaxID=694025 RepID=A0ABW0JDU7_9BURK
MAAKEDWFQSEDNSYLVEQASSLDMEHNSVIDHNGTRILLGHSTRNLPFLVRFVKAVFRTKHALPFKITTDGKGRKRVEKASALTEFVHRIHGMTELYSRDYHYAPALKLFFEVFEFHDIRFCTLKRLEFPFGDGKRTEADIVNDFVKVLREEGVRVNIVKQMNDWQNAIDDNATRTKLYMDALFERYSRLQVIRIDLNYKVACVSEQQLDEVKNQLQRQEQADHDYLYGDTAIEYDGLETQARFDVKVLNEDRKHLFANKRSKPSLFKHLVGYVWRIEWSRVSGHHLHVAFFFDGSKVQKDAWLGDQIGQYWVDVITQGRGLYHNCNGNKGAYGDRCGIGEVNYYDEAKRENLIHALGYLAKRSQYLYVKPTQKCNLFGTGHMPDEKPAAGRPRKKGIRLDE